MISLSRAREVRHDSWIIDLDWVRPPILSFMENRRAQSLRAPRSAESAGAGAVKTNEQIRKVLPIESRTICGSHDHARRRVFHADGDPGRTAVVSHAGAAFEP